MRRLLRILLNAVCLLSLLLSLAIAALWVRSYVRYDDVDMNLVFGPEGRRSHVDWGSIPNGRAVSGYAVAVRGQLFARVADVNALIPEASINTMGEDQPGCRWIHRPIRSTDQALSLSNRASLSEQGWMLGWFGGAHTKEDFHADADVVAYRANWLFTCPYWAPFALFAALPIMRVVTGVGRRRRVRGLRRASRCTTCGYDLRATPDRCPECGTVA